MGIISELIDGTHIEVFIKSSNLKSAKYDTESKNLLVTFNNDAIYQYEDVSWEKFTKFRMNESQGKFFNQNIAKTHKYTKIG